MKKQARKVALAAAIIASTVSAGAAQANFLNDIVKEISKAASVKISIDVWNHSSHPVRAVMDNNREIRDIAAGSVAKFSANFGDMPTFHFIDLNTGYQLGSKKVGSTGNSTIEWRG